MTPRFSLAIPHAEWIPERAAALWELGKALSLGVEPVPHRLFTDRTTHWVWADKEWKWSIAQDVTHCLFLTDDVHVAPCFWRALTAMVEAKPDVAIGLMSPLVRGVETARKGLRWYTIGAGVTGPAYLLPRELLREFVRWRGQKSWDFVTYWNEDSLINVFLSETGRYSWHPAPSIVDHNIEMPSSVGHVAKVGSRPTVLWDGRTPFVLGPGLPAFDIEQLCRTEFWSTEHEALCWPPEGDGTQATCIECGGTRECRPHGPGGAPVCHDCSISVFDHRLRGPQA